MAETRTEGGKKFPASDYPSKPSTWKLRLTATPGGAPDAGIVGAAAAALGKGFRGRKVSIPAADLQKVKAKVRAAWRKAHPDKEDSDMPPGIKESARLTIGLRTRSVMEALGREMLADPAFAHDVHAAALSAIHEAQGRSHDDTRRLVSDALRDKWRQGDDDHGPWIRDIWDDEVAFEHDGKTWIASYAVTTTDGEAAVTLGDRKQAMVKYVAVDDDASESDPPQVDGDVVEIREGAGDAPQFFHLLEKSVRTDGTVPVKVIQPGWGTSGYYSEKMLKAKASSAWPAGTKMYWDHPTAEDLAARPERSLRDLAAVTTEAARFDPEGPEGPGVYAEAKVAPAFRDTLDELGGHIGTSIFGKGIGEDGEADGRTGPIFEDILPGGSIDFVTEPGAGGKVMEVFESARARGSADPDRGKEQSMDKELREAREAKEQAERDATEAQQAKTAAETERDEARQETQRLREALVIRDARDKAYEAFAQVEEQAEITLLESTRKRLAEQVSKNPPTTDEGKLDEEAFATVVEKAIKDEVAYLSEIAGGSPVRGSNGAGGGDAPDPEKVSERVAKALEGLGMSESAAKAGARGR